MNLLIVESPEKAKHIKAMLGADWMVEASFGHVRDLPENGLGVCLENFTPTYCATERGAKTLSKLNARAKDAKAIFLATDPDREGEAIAWHIADELRLKNPHRVTWNEITAKAVKAALAAPRRIDMALVRAQEARRVVDRLVGYRVSPVLTEACSQRLSAGRVQSVAVRLVVERENEINKFKITNHYGAEILFSNGQKWKARWDSDSITSEDEPYVLDKTIAVAVASVRDVTIVKYDDKAVYRKPPAPFISTTLMKAASNALDVSPEAAMQAAQMLFDAGLITYHRTDFPNMSDEGKALAQDWLTKNNYAEHVSESPHKFAAASGAQEAHEAIRPTDFSIKEAHVEDGTAKKIYALIRDRALASVMKDAEYQQRSVQLESLRAYSELSGDKARFKATGRTMNYAGWISLLKEDAAEEREDESDADNQIPDLRGAKEIVATDGKVLELKTKAPKRYSESSLVDKLERLGIGRPSTYAAILKNIKTREYVKLDGKFFKPQASGFLVVENLIDRFNFMEYEYTRSLELELDQIAQGKKPYLDVVKAVNFAIELNIKALSETDQSNKHQCPDCGKVMRRIKSKDGFFWGCAGYPECRKSLFDNDGTPSSERPIEHACPDCKSALIRHRNKEGVGFWWGCSAWKNGCKYTADDKGGKPAKQYHCPQCKKPLKQREGSKGKFWSCTGYKDGCKFTADDNRGRPTLNTGK